MNTLLICSSGGGAVTHCAMLKGKWDKFIINDIDGRLPKLFVDCAHGKYTTATHPEWISREEFNRRKADDAYIALVWSFGNNGIDYIYGADLEPFKRDYHKAVFENNPELLKRWGYNITGKDTDDIYERYLHFNFQIKQQARSDLDSLVRQIEIERLQSLQSLQSDYQSVSIPHGAVIYCDPPYSGTNCGKYKGFDSERFYEWARKQDNIFISEYSMPEDFVIVAKIEKTVLSAANGNSAKQTEKIYTNRRTWDSLSADMRERYALNAAEQLSLW